MRRAVARIICAVVLLGLALALPAAAIAAKAKRPNIVMVVTDDQTLSQYDQRTMPKTRRLLENRGTTFTEAIVTTPLCCPSRATMITGQYGHNNGVLRNNYRDLKGEDNTLPVWLRRAGYTTLHVGKYMNQYADAVEPDTEVAPGWDEWHSVIAPRYFDYELMVNGASESFGGTPEDYLGRVLTERSTSLIDSYAPRRKPFYLQLDHFAPHISVDEGEGRCAHGAVPDPLDADRFTAEPLPQPPSFDEEDVSDKPSFVQELPRLSPATVADQQRLHGCALASLGSVDRSVDAVFDAVKSAGELDRTVFIYVSDNGVFAGEHQIPGSKQNPYEEAVRVPLVVRAPKAVLGGEAPGKVRRPVANIDLAPTILDLAGGEPCGKRGECRRMDGRSLVPLLEGRRGGWPRGRALVLELDRGRSPGGG